MTKTKDIRKVFKHEPIDLGDNTVHFDGKYNPETGTLKIYRYHGDINRSKEAIALFCSTYPFPGNKPEQINVITNFQTY